MTNKEKTEESSPETKQKAAVDNSPENYSEKRTQEISQKINSYQGPKNPDELSEKINEIQKNYQQNIKESNAKDNQKTLQLYQNKMQDEIRYYENEEKKYADLDRLRKATEILSPDDFQKMEKYLGNKNGSLENLFNPKEKLLHTTNSHAFLSRMLPQKRLLQNVKVNDEDNNVFEKKGAYFTDGDFEKSLTFNNMWDDGNEYLPIKNFNTEKYKDKAQDFVEYFWKDRGKHEIIKKHLSELGNTKLEYSDFDKAVKIAQGFKRKATPRDIKNNQDELNKMFGVTLVFKKKDIKEVTDYGAKGIQKFFEKRLYNDNGMSFNHLVTILVPDSKIEEIKRILKENELNNIEVKASEELEVRDFMENINK